jgi:hypothetical protein
MRRRHCAPHVRLAPCFEGSVCNDVLFRRSSSGAKQKTAARASEGASSSAARIVAGVTARVVRRGRGRTVEE